MIWEFGDGWNMMKYVKLLIEGKLKKARCFILYIHAWVVVALPFQPWPKIIDIQCQTKKDQVCACTGSLFSRHAQLHWLYGKNLSQKSSQQNTSSFEDQLNPSVWACSFLFLPCQARWLSDCHRVARLQPWNWGSVVVYPTDWQGET